MNRDTPTSLRVAREETIDALCRRFAADDLGMGELERRLDKARAARSREELRSLLADLEPRAVASPAERRPAAVPEDRAGEVPEAATAARSSTTVDPAGTTSGHLAFAVMGGTRRAGRWVPPTSMAAVAIMGGVELDFRDAVLRDDLIEINCFAFWGGIEITVPPDVNVDTTGFALMGGFEQTSDVESTARPGAPTIRVNGFALMAGVEIKVAERGKKLEGPDR